MAYLVKETFYTLQGEGGQAGRAAVFCRFAGCNLWTGREEDRATAACRFCDTDFVGTDGLGGGRFGPAADLAAHINQTWVGGAVGPGKRYVVFTGGEPLLQLDQALVDAMHEVDFEIAVETNGTQLPPLGIDWTCVSPKAGTELVLRSGTELKLVFPQPGLDPAELEMLDFEHFFLQPMDGANRQGNVRAATEYCLSHPRWRLSLQTHKLIGIP
jgi:7-carboxy-7-deazaguanine synthase